MIFDFDIWHRTSHARTHELLTPFAGKQQYVYNICLSARQRIGQPVSAPKPTPVSPLITWHYRRWRRVEHVTLQSCRRVAKCRTAFGCFKHCNRPDPPPIRTALSSKDAKCSRMLIKRAEWLMQCRTKLYRNYATVRQRRHDGI